MACELVRCTEEVGLQNFLSSLHSFRFGLKWTSSESSFSIIRSLTRPTDNHQATSMKKNANLNVSNSVSYAYLFIIVFSGV